MAAGHHSSLTTPPNIPAINGLIPKHRKQESLAEAVAGIVSSMRNPDHNINQSATCANVVITSSTVPVVILQSSTPVVLIMAILDSLSPLRINF